MPQYSKKPIWGQHAAHLPEKYVSDLWDELHKLEEPIDHLFMRPAAATGRPRVNTQDEPADDAPQAVKDAWGKLRRARKCLKAALQRALDPGAKEEARASQEKCLEKNRAKLRSYTDAFMETLQLQQPQQPQLLQQPQGDGAPSPMMFNQAHDIFPAGAAFSQGHPQQIAPASATAASYTAVPRQHDQWLPHQSAKDFLAPAIVQAQQVTYAAEIGNPPNMLLQQHPAQQHPVQQHPVQQHPAQQHPAQQHPAQQHPAQQHPAQQQDTQPQTINNIFDHDVYGQVVNIRPGPTQQNGQMRPMQQPANTNLATGPLYPQPNQPLHSDAFLHPAPAQQQQFAPDQPRQSAQSGHRVAATEAWTRNAYGVRMPRYCDPSMHALHLGARHEVEPVLNLRVQPDEFQTELVTARPWIRADVYSDDENRSNSRWWDHWHRVFNQ